MSGALLSHWEIMLGFDSGYTLQVQKSEMCVIVFNKSMRKSLFLKFPATFHKTSRPILEVEAM